MKSILLFRFIERVWPPVSNTLRRSYFEIGRDLYSGLWLYKKYPQWLFVLPRTIHFGWIALILLFIWSIFQCVPTDLQTLMTDKWQKYERQTRSLARILIRDSYIPLMIPTNTQISDVIALRHTLLNQFHSRFCLDSHKWWNTWNITGKKENTTDG